MTIPKMSGPDPVKSRIRWAMNNLDKQIAQLPRTSKDEDGRERPNGVVAAFNDLVELLALGPEPELRECPVCSHVCLREATLCSYCWSKMTPPPKQIAQVATHA